PPDLHLQAFVQRRWNISPYPRVACRNGAAVTRVCKRGMLQVVEWVQSKIVRMPGYPDIDEAQRSRRTARRRQDGLGVSEKLDLVRSIFAALESGHFPTGRDLGAGQPSDRGGSRNHRQRRCTR